MKSREDERDARELREWADHQYVEGYYTEGRVPPFYKSKHRSRFGYGLLLIGSLALAALVLAASTSSFALDTVLTMLAPALLVVLTLAAGVALLRKPSRE